MPITKSAKNALRQNKRRRAENSPHKINLKNLTKKALLLARQSKVDELKGHLTAIYKAVDKAVKKGILKKNTAARRKSRIAKKLNALLATAQQK